MENGNIIAIVSFVLSLILCVLTFIVLPMMIWRAIAATAASGELNNSAVVAAGTLGLVLLVLAIVGLVLGIFGTVTADSKTFGILGTVFSAICLLVILGAMAIGFAATS